MYKTALCLSDIVDYDISELWNDYDYYEYLNTINLQSRVYLALKAQLPPYHSKHLRYQDRAVSVSL